MKSGSVKASQLTQWTVTEAEGGASGYRLHASEPPCLLRLGSGESGIDLSIG